MRPSKVIYDRAHSAIAEADAADFDFDAIMEGADWFHWSGITPAISDKAAELTRLACEAAKRHGVTVSVDLNFRKKLWTKEKAQSIMKPLMQYVDVCVDGEYEKDKRNVQLHWKGSSNQRVIDVPKSLETGKVCLYCE